MGANQLKMMNDLATPVGYSMASNNQQIICIRAGGIWSSL
jgi:hypothetical protein